MIGTPGGSVERPATFFDDAQQWRAWLEQNHEHASEVWMGLKKKHVADRGLVWADAVMEALCFGWIDSVAQRVDEDHTRQRFTPRRPGSVWSDTNIALVAELTAQGRMAPAGLRAFESRKVDDHRSYSYENKTTWPAEHEARVQSDPRAAAFLSQAPAGYRKVAQHWVMSAKLEATRERRLLAYIADSAAGRLIAPQRYGDPPRWLDRARAQTGKD